MTLECEELSELSHYSVVALVGGKDLNKGHSSRSKLEQCFGMEIDSNDGVLGWILTHRSLTWKVR